MIATSPADLTPEVLTRALQTRLPGAHVQRCRVEPVIGERGIASTVLRVHLFSDQRSALPDCVIAKFPPAHPAARAQLHAMGFFEREVGFYEKLADQTPVRTLACYRAEYDHASGDAFLLFEDLAPARNGDSLAPSTVEEVAVVLSELAQMHARWWQDSSLGHQSWLTLRSMLAPSAVSKVFEQSWPSFVRKLSIPVDDEILAMKTWISSNLARAATTLFDTGPRTLIHNDVQGDNMFFPADPDPSVVFIDWQLASFARGAVDVASAVRGSLAPELRRLAEAQLLRHYHAALVEAGVRDYSLAHCRADYDLAAVLAPARMASAVALSPALTAHPGAPWDTLFPRLGRN